jgi:hypothetical protein
MANNTLISKYFLFFGLILFILNSCQEDKQLGADLLPNVGIDTTIYSDTFSIETSIIQLDSINTTFGNLLLGNVENEGVGKTHADFYFELAYNSLFDSRLPANTLSFDSITLVFSYINVYGDKNKNLKLKIFELNDTLKNVHYEFETLPSINNVFGVLAEREIVLKETTAFTDTFEIKLRYDYGFRLFNANKDTTIKSQRDLNTKVTKGIKISCENLDDASILSIPKSYMNLRLYYTTFDTAGTYRNQKLLLPAKKFTNISFEKEGELLNLTKRSKLSTQFLNNKCFVYPAASIATLIKFPNLKNMETEDYHILVNRAELLIEPVDEFISPNKILPQNLYLALAEENGMPFRYNGDTLFYLRSEPILQDPNNVIEPPLVYYYVYNLLGRSIIPSILSRISYNDAANNYYSLYNNMITNYIQQVIDGKETHGIYLFGDYPGYDLTMPDNSVYNSNVNSLIFGDNKHPQSPLKLRVYYTKLPK